jgi:hypothetical protein
VPLGDDLIHTGLTAKVSIFISICDKCEETPFLNYFHHREGCLERVMMQREAEI